MNKLIRRNLVPIALSLLSAASFIAYLAVPSQFPMLASLACWFAAAIPLTAVIIHRKKIKWIWLVGPFSFALLIAGLEVGLRLGPLNARFLPLFVGKDFEPHPYLFWVPKNMEETDIREDGIEPYNTRLDLRKRVDHIDKSSGCFRVITMGGSNAWGWGVKKYADTFTPQLEQLVTQKHPDRDFEFIPGGMRSFCLFQNLVFYKLFLRALESDLVILYCNVNDATTDFGPYTYRELFQMRTGVDISRLWIDVHTFPKRKSLLWNAHDSLRKMRTYNALVLWITDSRKEVLPEKLRTSIIKEVNPVTDYEQNLVDLINMVQLDGAEVLLTDAYMCCNLNQRILNIRRVMERVAKERNVPFVSVHSILSSMFQPEELVFPNDREHINEFGHKEVARLIFEELVKQGLLEPAEKTS